MTWASSRPPRRVTASTDRKTADHKSGEAKAPVVFIRLGGGGDSTKEVVRAVNELDESQLFNVISLDAMQKKPTLFVTRFVPATDLYKKKLTAELKPYYVQGGDLFEAIDLASRGPADLIWIVGWLGAANEDVFVRDVKKSLKSEKTRINTSIAFAQSHPVQDLHLMWRVAKETGGVCLGEDGEPIEEPILPAAPCPRGRSRRAF